MAYQIRTASIEDTALFEHIADAVFDYPITPERLVSFLKHPGHAITIAIEDKRIIGFASGNTYLHPDKPIQAWINEVSVAPTHRQRGVAKALIKELESALRAKGAQAIWLATEHDNTAARATYRSLGYTETEGIVMYEHPDN